MESSTTVTKPSDGTVSITSAPKGKVHNPFLNMKVTVPIVPSQTVVVMKPFPPPIHQLPVAPASGLLITESPTKQSTEATQPSILSLLPISTLQISDMSTLTPDSQQKLATLPQVRAFPPPVVNVSKVEVSLPVQEAEMTAEELQKIISALPEVTQSMSIYEATQIIKYRCPSWLKLFDECQREIAQISESIGNFAKTHGPYVPLMTNLYRTFEVTPLNRVRVVVIGQDPYFQIRDNGLPRATGMSFSVARDDEIPSSLRNIFKEISTCYPNWRPFNGGDLTHWGVQGVLMLNYCLTCGVGEADSHAKYGVWMPFIQKVLAAINAVRPNCIYVMWGAKAQKLTHMLGDRSIKLTAVHPSGLSASRGFYGCAHFTKINEYLKSFNEEEIRW